MAALIRLAVWPLLIATTAAAQEPGELPPGEAPPEAPAETEAPPADPGEEEPAAPEPLPASAAPAASPAAASRDPAERNRDIMVVPHRAVLKDGRIELAPSAGININDDLVSDFALGGEARYFLSEALSLGLLFEYFPTPGGKTELELDVRRRYLKFPAHNEYVFAGNLIFGYVPIYGKFTFFGAKLIHWESFVEVGPGIMSTKTIPRSAAYEPQTNYNVAGSAALGVRFFLSRWLSVLFTVRDFVFNDKFEVEDRPSPDEPVTESRLVNHVLLSMGIGIYFPTDFKYTTLR